MDPVAPLVIVAAIVGAAALAWRSTRSKYPRGRRRTTWKIVCFSCERIHRRPSPDCEECRSTRMMPLSKYQAEGGGTGFWPDPDGPMVSSLLEGEWTPSDDESNRPQGRFHAPLFDLDYPVMLRQDERFAVLVIEKHVAVHAFLRVVEALERCRLSPPGTHALVSSQRAELPGVDSKRVSHGMSSVGFPFSVPAALVPSSTPGHFHLYLEAEVAWDDYAELMRVMAEARLIETSWYEMCVDRRMAMLRKPDFKKAST